MIESVIKPPIDLSRPTNHESQRVRRQQSSNVPISMYFRRNKCIDLETNPTDLINVDEVVDEVN